MKSKFFHELLLSDFEQYELWGSGGEKDVYPIESNEHPDIPDILYHDLLFCKGQSILSDGSKWDSLCTFTGYNSSTFHCLEFFKKGERIAINFITAYSLDSYKKEMKEICDFFEKKEDEIFPLCFSSYIKIIDRTLAGVRTGLNLMMPE